MTGWAAVALLAAGFIAGTMNAVVGSGSLISFPILLALGFPPVVANVSNTVGLAFGAVSGAIGYRRELRSQYGRVAWLTLPALAGAVAGAVLLLTLPQRVFSIVVTPLIILAIVLVIAQPWLRRHIAQRAEASGVGVMLPLGVFFTAVYGAYFGAAQGVILVSLLLILLSGSLHRLNALRNAIVMLVNCVAAVIFVLFAGLVAWEPALLIAGSSIVGGQVGAKVARRLPPAVLRGVIVASGIAAVIKLLL